MRKPDKIRMHILVALCYVVAPAALGQENTAARPTSPSNASTGVPTSNPKASPAPFYPNSLKELELEMSSLLDREYLRTDIARAARVLNSLKAVELDYVYNKKKIRGKLVDLKIDQTHCWLQVQVASDAKKIPLDVYAMNKRAASESVARLTVGGRDIERYLSDLLMLISNADVIEETRSSADSSESKNLACQPRSLARSWKTRIQVRTASTLLKHLNFRQTMKENICVGLVS